MRVRVAIPSNDGEEISQDIRQSILFLVYDIEKGAVRSRTKRAQLHGIMATVQDCDLVVGKQCPEPIRELLAVKGILTVSEKRTNADRAVEGLLKQNLIRKWMEGK